MATAALQRISNNVRNIGGENFRNAAANDNNSMHKIVKDLARMFDESKTYQKTTNSVLSDIQQQATQTTKESDESNSLIQESISIQTQMLAELKTLSKSLTDLLGGSSGLGGITGAGSGLGRLLGLGGAGLGLGLLGNEFLGGDSAGSGFSGGDSNFKPLSRSLASKDLAPEETAILETIASGESSGAYNVINYVAGGGKPKYFEMGENPKHPFQDQKGYTAAGRYQFLWTTWKDELEAMGLDPYKTPFSPEMQDKVAASHAKRRYHALTGRDLTEDIKSKNPEILSSITNTLRPTWHGIGGGNYLGQAYNNALNPDKPNATAQDSNTETYDRVIQSQAEKAGIRKQPLDPELVKRLNYAAQQASASTESNLKIEVTSGGQPSSGPNRTGTHEHDHGGAADFNLMITNEDGSTTTLDPRIPAHQKYFESLTRSFAESGGRSAGALYMDDPTKIHFGTSRNTPKAYAGPDWFRKSFNEGRSLFLKNGFDVAALEPNVPESTSTTSPETPTAVDSPNTTGVLPSVLPGMNSILQNLTPDQQTGYNMISGLGDMSPENIKNIFLEEALQRGSVALENLQNNGVNIGDAANALTPPITIPETPVPAPASRSISSASPTAGSGSNNTGDPAVTQNDVRNETSNAYCPWQPEIERSFKHAIEGQLPR